MTERLKQIVYVFLILFIIVLSYGVITQLRSNPASDPRILWSNGKNEFESSDLFKRSTADKDPLVFAEKELVIVSGAVQEKVVVSGAPRLRVITYQNMDAKSGKMGAVLVDLPISEKDRYMALKSGQVIQMEGTVEKVAASYWDEQKKDMVFKTLEEAKAEKKDYYYRVVFKATKWL